jgi:ComF family protein
MFDSLFDYLVNSFAAIVFPEKCRGCYKSGTALCQQCLSQIPLSPTITELNNAIALWNYHHPLVRQAIWELKYHRKSPAAKILAQTVPGTITDFLADTLQTTVQQTIVLVPIPQHYSKTFDRGFNQSQLVATWLQKVIPTAQVETVLSKSRATTAQARSQNKRERQKNVHNSMKATKVLSESILYIVVDDVITTGSTIREASRALRAAGAKNICAIAIAHGELR